MTFQSAASVFAVCAYCTSTLLRRGAQIEDIGKMAALMDDPTPIRIGTEGVHLGVHFAVIGRIQMRYAAGLWNEWHLLFDDMRTGWLAGTAGEYFVTFERPVARALPPFAAIRIEQAIDLGDGVFDVTSIENATCVAGEGELPFAVGAGYAAPVVDLRDGARFATLDYSDAGPDGTPRLFVGTRVEDRALRLTGLRTPGDAATRPRIAADAFNCPACAAPFALSSGRIRRFGCASCGALVDTDRKEVRLITRAQEALDAPLALPLGSAGVLAGTRWQVIGHLRRASRDGFAWDEYLLFEERAGFAWLIESDGHWTFARNADKPFKKIGTLAFRDGVSYEHFAHYLAEVRHVLGEFYWKVKVGDTVAVDDYIAPPAIASRELDAGEVTWSLGTYVEPAEIAAAFKPPAALPARRGIAPNQPSPWTGVTPRLWKAFAAFTLAGVVLQLWFALTTSEVRRETVRLAPGVENAMLSEPFRVDGAGSLALRADTDLDNAWAGLSVALVDPASGRVWRADQEIESWSGIDADGDRWSEGSASALVSFGRIPAGTYRLQVEGEVDPGQGRAVTAVLTLERGHASWFNWLLLQAGFLSVPGFGAWRARAFERRRMAGGDHGDDDED
ncbi:MAG: DUF4178 domain-containing protein [Burkholderiales bacterium]|nr:DUF4178 domain-containing protein [Burkholderiales bacterium]